MSSESRTRGFVFECRCGASFGTRAEDLTQAAADAEAHHWAIVLHRCPGHSIAIDWAMCPACVRKSEAI